MTPKAVVRHSGDVAIVDLSGRITLGEGSGLVRGTIKELTGAGSRNILLNLKDVTYIDSAGLGTLVAGFTSAQNQGASLKLAKLTSRFSEILHITKLVTVFDVFPTVEEAVNSFPPAS